MTGILTDRTPVRRWTHAGLDCVMLDSKIGFVNGYVRLPDDHFARRYGYGQLNRGISIHGGLTYGADSDGWVGFDTGHSGDHWPGMDRYAGLGPAEIIWSLERLAGEVDSLADQLASLTELPDPTETWECTDAEFRRILRESRAWRRLRSARAAS